ncbi:hypothetical protein EDC04DRAFT_2898190 [Pisolithus marmoratus]|nr:hypothetical protein EDC04DRAFT_2898190 [Pisolithus marmoratus]
MATTLGKRKSREDQHSEHGGHGSTLFVSNLPYNATSTDLKTAFSDLAPVRSAFVVLERGTGVPKGVGYVSFAIREDAKTAFDTITSDGMTMNGRKLRVEWAGRKPKNRPTKERPAMPKVDSVKKEAEVKFPTSNEDDDDDVEEDSEDDREEDIEDEESSAEDNESEATKPKLPQTDVGTTLFIRNIPFTATEDELRTLFRAWGPLRYARITIDPETERSRGTGFVCFWNKGEADKVIEQSDILRTETMGNQPQPTKNPFTLPSILTPDPSSSIARNLVLHGRTLDVVRAVTRDQAAKLKEEGEKTREKADKRNLYLLREGAVLPNTPAAETLPPAEVERRTNSFNSRRALLRSNPSLYVSRTRLSIRRIPLFVTERVLKRLAVHAIKAFNAEVKAQLREGLDPDELAEPSQDALGTDQRQGETTKSRKQGKKFGRPTPVKQVKIVRQQDRIDPITGMGRSRGYGFVEMHRHADALRVLRWANNNPEIGTFFDKWWREELADLIKEKAKDVPDEARIKRMKDALENPSKPPNTTLIVEFAVENVQIVQRRSLRQKEKRVRSRTQDDSTKTTEPPSKKRRISIDQPKHAQVKNEEPPKPGRLIGSLIGRKRRARKTGK